MDYLPVVKDNSVTYLHSFADIFVTKRVVVCAPLFNYAYKFWYSSWSSPAKRRLSCAPTYPVVNGRGKLQNKTKSWLRKMRHSESS